MFSVKKGQAIKGQFCILCKRISFFEAFRDSSQTLVKGA